uniref:Small ribosomal subunit protein mS31 n=1 Tax=Graphocephala atropunctata TaxID=36148 RepID=A0A1B6LRN0_9HEMI
MISLQKYLSKCSTYSQLRSFTCSTGFSSKKDELERKDEKDTSKEKVNNKLNDLLKLMIQKEDNIEKDVKLPQAVKRKRIKPEKEKPLGEKLEVAAKDVAASLGGNAEKTESELLNILLRSPDPNTQTLKNVLQGIKVEKSSESPSRAQQVRDTLLRQAGRNVSEVSKSMQMKPEFKKPKKKSAAMVDILGTAPSTYFKDLQPVPVPCVLHTWRLCAARDLRLAITHPPTNIYEQMVQWTDQGMLWQFPIDNEQGLEDEKQVSFEEHIFLESHLEGWCPEKGPIRHFMELVCVGLSKNHWLTVEEKKEHIFWYRDYFNDKKDLISELGAGTLEVDSGQQEKNKEI